MQADNSHHLIAAARRRSHTTQRRAVAAVRRLDTTGVAITFDAVAREASVSAPGSTANPSCAPRSKRLRQRPGRTAARRLVPDRQHASNTSLLSRLDLATERIRRLETDNQQLRRALAAALGERRAATTPDTPRRQTHA